MARYKSSLPAIAALVLAAALPLRSEAQTPPMLYSIDVSGGMVMTMGDFGEVADAGMTAIAGFSYMISPRLALRAEGAVDVLAVSDASVMDDGTMATADIDLRVWHGTGGLEFHLLDPTGSAMVALTAGAGVSTWDSSPFTIGRDDGETTTYAIGGSNPSFSIGARLGVSFAEHAGSGVRLVSLFANGGMRVLQNDASKTVGLADAKGVSNFDSAMSMRVTAGLRINIP